MLTAASASEPATADPEAASIGRPASSAPVSPAAPDAEAATPPPSAAGEADRRPASSGAAGFIPAPSLHASADANATKTTQPTKPAAAGLLTDGSTNALTNSGGPKGPAVAQLTRM